MFFYARNNVWGISTMKSEIIFTRLTTLLLLMACLADASASVVYQYIGNHFNSFSSPTSYDNSMMVRITLELPSELAPNFNNYVFPTKYSFEDGMQIIDNSNATSTLFMFETDENGDILSWAVAAEIDAEFKAIHTLKHFSNSDAGEDFAIILDDWGQVGETPGSWTVLPIPSVDNEFPWELFMPAIQHKNNNNI
jgi:hypothetical protein